MSITSRYDLNNGTKIVNYAGPLYDAQLDPGYDVQNEQPLGALRQRPLKPRPPGTFVVFFGLPGATLQISVRTPLGMSVRQIRRRLIFFDHIRVRGALTY